MSNTTMGEALIDASTRKELKALSDGLNGLRERLDAELRLVHHLVTEIEAKQISFEARITELEGRMYVSPELMASIEKGSRQ